LLRSPKNMLNMTAPATDKSTTIPETNTMLEKPSQYSRRPPSDEEHVKCGGIALAPISGA
ncbi:hypothetical protein M3C20_10775, partial [Brevibacterium luteolum]|uniref:hypothetical protein n=1 Tax=Brevibacterium luteolum TaxID=199591 RepID=UPI00223B4E93